MTKLLRIGITFLCALFAMQVHAASSLRVSLAPTDAVNAGARWRVDGGAWQISGTTIKSLAPGSHTLEYKAVSGWITPASQAVTTTNGTTAYVSSTYVRAATLSIALSPTSGTWQCDGGAWQPSGATITELAPGDHRVEYGPVSGFITPSSENITLAAAESASLTRRYVRETSVTLNLSPASAQWRVYLATSSPSGEWHASGATVAGLLPGRYLIEYSTVPGYEAPTLRAFDLASEQQQTLSATYTPIPPRLSVSLTPATGSFRVNGGDWLPSGSSVILASPGNCLLEFATIANYETPAPQTVSLAWGDVRTVDVSYTPIPPATVTVTTAPVAATFRFNGGEWFPSGTTMHANAGTYSIEFSAVAGYLTPAPVSVTLAPGEIRNVFATYERVAHLTVVASAKTAQWRVNRGNWLAEGATVELPAGSYEVEYGPAAGYMIPTPETVALAAGENRTLYPVYVTGNASLQVTLTPAPGKWRVDGGAWIENGVTAQVGSGPHLLEYAPVAGYTPPAAERITLELDETRALARTYMAYSPVLTVLKRFFDAGEKPAVALGRDGYLYIATTASGSTSKGMIVRVTPDGSSCAVLKTFTSNAGDIQVPLALIEGTDGVLYGTTRMGGVTSNDGAVFRVGRDGSGFTVIAKLSSTSGSYATRLIECRDGKLCLVTVGKVSLLNKDGSGLVTIHQSAGVVGATEGPDGRLYLTSTLTSTGATGGRLYRIERDGTAQMTLKDFVLATEGATPKSEVLFGTNGMIYGTTSAGGSFGKGVLYCINPDGTGFGVLHHFSGDALDGGRVEAPPTEGPDGRLYGITYNGGAANAGTLFAVDKSGAGYTVLRAFAASAAEGRAATHRLLITADGSIFGAATLGGGDGRGLVFKATSDGSSYTAVWNCGAPEGAEVRGIMEASNGVLYGTAEHGGGISDGALFKVNKDGTGFAVLHSFDTRTEYTPRDAPTECSDGLLYGVTMSGPSGSGTLFRIAKDGTNYTVIYAFAASGGGTMMPWHSVIEGTDGRLYGTTIAGGTLGGYGTLYRVNRDGSGFAILRSFGSGSRDGNTPYGRLTEAPDGFLYGVNYHGGIADQGTLFRVAKDGSEYTVLHTFDATVGDGVRPSGTLQLASDGRLYGVTTAGGSSGKGTAFRIDLGGAAYTVLKHFTGIDGESPAGVVEKDGLIYGTTSSGGAFGSGVAFCLSRDGSAFSVAINFGVDDADGRTPTGSLCRSTDGSLYGVTFSGANAGTVFRLETN